MENPVEMLWLKALGPWQRLGTRDHVPAQVQAKHIGPPIYLLRRYTYL